MLIFRPFRSLSVLVVLVGVGAFVMGASAIADSRRGARRWPDLAAGALWVAVAVVVLGWPDITTRALALVVGAALVVGGMLEIVAGVRSSTDERAAAVVGGVASVIFGVLALSWPSITVLVVAVVFGFRLMAYGLRLAWASFRDREGMTLPEARPPDVREAASADSVTSSAPSRRSCSHSCWPRSAPP